MYFVKERKPKTLDPYTSMVCHRDYLKKPMMPLKTLDIIFRRRYVPNTQYYLTNRKHAAKDKPHHKKSSHFIMPRSEKILSYIKHSDKKQMILQQLRMKQPIYLKDNERFAQTRNISHRLYVKEPRDEVKSIYDLDNEFYTLVEGRPVRAATDIKVYITNIRQYSALRQQIGYRNDIILKMEKNMTEEAKCHEEIDYKLKLHVRDFKRFLTEDHKAACAKVAKAELIAGKLVTAHSDLLGVISSLTTLHNLIFKLDSIRSVLKRYRQYLLFVSPIAWRQQFDHSFKNRTMSILYEDFTDDELVESLDIDKIVELAKVELNECNAPHMYFTLPEEMVSLFRDMELQSREYSIQYSKTVASHRRLISEAKHLKRIMSIELDCYSYFVDYFKRAIDRELYNEIHLQQIFFRILEESFFDSVASPGVLKLKICIEFVFEEMFGKSEEGHDNLYEPMKMLESLYEELNLKLDCCDFSIVNDARNEYFANDIKTMWKANYAQRELKAFKEMTVSINKACLPPAHFKRPAYTKFMNKKELAKLARAAKKKQEIESGERIKSDKYKVTPEQRECLIFFTNWCEGTDPKPFLKEYEEYVKPIF